MLSEILFDPFLYATQEDPFPSYQRLREEFPVWRSPEHGFYAIARHADVLAALGDAESIDFIADYAAQIPLDVICEIGRNWYYQTSRKRGLFFLLASILL